MSKPWGGKIGSWAAEAELVEAEELQAAATAAANPQTFPSLKDSVSSKPKKKKMSLAEFYGSGQPGSGSNTTRLTHDEMIRLPTGPTQRSPDEYVPGSRGGWGPSQDRRGGGFDSGPRRGGGGGGGDYDSAPPPPPSRADEVADWGASKRSAPIERERERGGGGGGSGGSNRYGDLGGGSRADDVDNWSLGKKALPPPQSSVGPTRSNTFGRTESGSDWRRGGDLGTGSREVPVSRPRLVLDPRSSNQESSQGDSVVKVNKASPFGEARPREEVLTEKGLDWKKLDSDIEAKKVSFGGGGGSRPTSSQGSRPTSSQSNRAESVVAGGGGGVEVKTRVKVNPFGEAKPREVLLEEKGLDWRKIDLQLENRRVERPETEEEKALKEEIENLQKNLEKESGNDVSQGSGGEQTNLPSLIESKERDLENLTRELDDKVRFGQKALERPGSGSGRPGSGAGRPGSGAGRPGSGAGRPGSGAGPGRHMSFQERHPQSGTFDDYRGTEGMNRPRSRGTGDVWTRPGEDNRRGSFQGNREFRDGGNFQGNREFRDGGSFQGNREFRDGGSFQGNREFRDGGNFQGNREFRDGGFLNNRDFNRPAPRGRW